MGEAKKTSICRLFRRYDRSAKCCRRVLHSDNNFGRFPCRLSDSLGRPPRPRDAPRIESAIRSVLADGAEGAVVLLDFGSALLSLEVALEMLEPEDRARVRVSDAPLVEGAFLAGVQASTGASLDDVAEAARGWQSLPKVPEA